MRLLGARQRPRYELNQKLILEERRKREEKEISKVDQAARMIVRDGLEHIDRIYREVFGVGLIDPSVATKIDKRVREFRSRPSLIPDY